MAVIDAVVRFLEGSLGDAASSEEESFSPALDGPLEYPHYTRPRGVPRLGRARGAAVGRPRTVDRGAWRREQAGGAHPQAPCVGRAGLTAGADDAGTLRGRMSVIHDIERSQLRTVPQFKPGDTVQVHFRVIEGQRQRVQVFEGICIKRQGHGVRETFTVRKQSFGVGVERTFPVHSPKIDRIHVAAIGDVSRAKLYYLRQKVGKKARVREKQR